MKEDPEGKGGTGREKAMGRESEKFRAVYHDSGRSTIFDIYTAARPLREFELHSSGPRGECFIDPAAFPEERYHAVRERGRG